jgi:molybdopterin synthase catalytic subunit
MRTIRVLAFAQAADALGFREREMEVGEGETVRAVMGRLAAEGGRSESEGWADWRVALDREYAGWDAVVGGATELAVIPPVSGG